VARRVSKDGSQIDNVYELLFAAPAGLHDLAAPKASLPDDAPLALKELYVLIGGARLFHEAIVFAPPAEVHRQEEPDRWWCGSFDDQDLTVDSTGRVLCWDESIDEWLAVGSRLDRWLWGMVDSQSLMFDAEGEFVDDVFDDDGELSKATELAQCKAMVRRDGAAAAQRWRLGALLCRQGELHKGREQLENCVEAQPDFYWAWLELARVSEQLGELDGAYDEALAASQAAQRRGAIAAGYLWSHVARLAQRRNASIDRDTAAHKVQQLAPTLRSEQLTGLRDCLERGDRQSAQGLVELMRAVWPRDVEVLDLAHRVAAMPESASEAVEVDQSSVDADLTQDGDGA
jgi:tetratricopeptide (TPR) repeat protein